MDARVLVDTNVLVYAYDSANTAKQQIALNVLDELVSSGIGVLSVQVLAEFTVAVTRKIANPLNFDAVLNSVQNYLRSWTVIDLTGLIILEAVRGVREYSFSYWDAQIWAAARLNQIPVIYSEDFASGSTVEGVTFINPFDGDFKVTQIKL
jgi:predicted nucleic acid-binding protein